MMQDKAALCLVRILVQVIDPIGIEQRGPAFHAMNNIAFPQQELRQIGAILSGNAGDQSNLLHRNPRR